MTKNKAIEMLDKMYDSLIIEEEICSDCIGVINDEQFFDKLCEITDKKLALLTAIDALEGQYDKS